MKKIILLVGLLFCSIAFGQKTTWGPWTQHNCYKGISLRAKRNDYNESAKKWHWSFQIKNSYNTKVAISWAVKEIQNPPTHTTHRATIKAGAIESTWYLRPTIGNGTSGNELAVIIDDVCFHYPNGFDQCSKYNSKGYASFAECDNGTPNYKIWDGNKNSNDNQNGNSHSGNSQTTNASNTTNAHNNNSGLSLIEEYNKYWGRREELCQKISDLDTKAKYILRTDYPCNTRETINDNEKKPYALQALRRDCEKLENILAELQGSSQQVEDKKQRLSQEKQEKYSSYIEQGDQAMQNEDYTSAMSHYQNAKQYASTDMERSTAENKYNQAFQARKAAERKVRIAEQNKRDEQENIAYTSGLTAAAGAMALLKDKPSMGFTSGKMYLGLNIEQIPMVSNNASSYHANKSYIEAPFRPGFDLGLIFGIANNKNVSLYINPKLSYNISAFASGVSGGGVEYGGSGLVRGNWNKEFPLKLYAEAGYYKRVGDYHYDADAAAESAGTATTTDEVRDGDYNYSIIRYGGGLMLHRVDEPDEFYVKAGVYFDKPSFYPKGMKPNLGFTLQGMYNKVGTLEFYYAPKYFIGGTVLYPSTLERTDKSYIGFRFTRIGRLW